ncbi:ComEC/Rec2 family competence protein [Cryomorphaceae bacterium 1068]|nr:ComEC/Rec2 family competence protein [Cryomorphaceae bacterium 1068]
MELFLHQAPLVRILVPLLLGLISALNFDSCSDLKLVWISAVLVIIGLLFSLNRIWKNMLKNHYFGILSVAAFFLLGMALGYRAISVQTGPPEGSSFLAVIESSPIEKPNSYAVHLKVFKVQIDSQLYRSCNARIIAYVSKDNFDSRIVPGNSIQFSGSISNLDQELYPNQFDYGRYLRNTGISGSVYIPRWSYEVISVHHFSLKGKLNKLRGNLLEKLNEDSIPTKEFGVISALLVGDRSFLDPQLRSDFADAGAVHILAVSGLHVGIIYLLFLTILNFLFKKNAKLLKFILVLLMLWGYAALTGFSPSVLRAATMFSFIALGKFNKRYTNTYNMIAASALVLLVINPLLITQIGFQLSYLAVLGIVFFHPIFYASLDFKNKYISMLWSLFCVSFAAQLATFPLSIYYFNQFPLLFFITNILVIPLASIILYSGIAWVLLLWVPYASDVMGWVTIRWTWLLNWIIETINTLPFAKIDGLYLSSLSAFIIYVVIILITIFLLKPATRVLRLLILATACLLFLFLNRRIGVVLQDDVLLPLLGESPTIIRLVQDEMIVYSQDTATFSANWRREIYPYLLTKGVRDPEKIRFVNLDEDNDILNVRMSENSSEGHHIIWNLREERIHTANRKEPARVFHESNAPLFQIESYDLIRFSNDSLLLQK